MRSRRSIRNSSAQRGRSGLTPPQQQRIGPDAVEVAVSIGRAGIDSVVLDCETGTRPLGLAARLAESMGAHHVPVVDLETTTLVRSITAPT